MFCVGLNVERQKEEAKKKATECLEIDAACVAARRFLILNGEEKDAKEVKTHCELLSNGIDKIRTKYWRKQEQAATKLLA